MTKITGAILSAVKRSGMTEAEILAALAPKAETALTADPRTTRRRGKYETRDMRAEA